MPVARPSARSGPIYGKFNGVVTIPYNDSYRTPRQRIGVAHM